MAWGFRWDGRATAEDLLRAVLASDPRLFAVADGSVSNGLVLWGLGFDANQNARFGLRGPAGALAMDRFVSGPVVALNPAVAAATELDPGDWYAVGPGGGAWQVWREAGGQGGWTRAPAEDGWERVGTNLAQIELRDGAWVGLSVKDPGSGRPPGEARPAGPPRSPFGSRLVAVQGNMGPAPYNDPRAVLGEPARWFYDSWGWVTGRAALRRTSLVEPAYGPSGPDGTNLLVTLPEASAVIVAWDEPIIRDEAHPYGVDFLVFGNAFFVTGGVVGDTEDFEDVWLDGRVFEEPLVVSVSPGYTGAPGEVETDPSTWPWYRYESGPFADTAFPTQGYLWDRVGRTWSDIPTDFTLPVHPGLHAWLQGGRWRAAQVMEWYGRSGGGTGFGLARVGVDSARYVRIEGLGPDRAWGEVDAVARVRPAQWGDELLVLPGDAGADPVLWFRDAENPGTGARVGVNVLRLDAPVWVRMTRLESTDRLEDQPACVWLALRMEIRPAADLTPTDLLIGLTIQLPVEHAGPARLPRLWVNGGAGWQRHGLVPLPGQGRFFAGGFTGTTSVSLMEDWRPSLQVVRLADGLALAWEALGGWRYVLERSRDWGHWEAVASWMPSADSRLEWRELTPATVAFYRVRVEAP